MRPYQPFNDNYSANSNILNKQNFAINHFKNPVYSARTRNQRIISMDSLKPSKKPMQISDKSSIKFSCIIQQNSPPYTCSEFWQEKLIPKTSSKSDDQQSYLKEKQKSERYTVNREDRKRLTLQTQSFPLQSAKNPLTYSYSFDDSDQSSYDYQKRLFSKFLNSQGLEWIQIYTSMQQTINKESKILDFIKIGENEALIEQNKILAHFICIHLEAMEYHDSQNRERIIQNIELVFNQTDSIKNIAQELYQTLFQGYMPSELQIRILLQLCKRGWEYYTFLCCRFIRLLIRRKNLGDFAGQFYDQLEQIIINQCQKPQL